MEQVYVESAKTGIIYITDLPIYDYLMRNKDFLEFPELSIKKQDEFLHPDYVLRYINSNEREIKYQDHELTIKYPQNEVNCSLDQIKQYSKPRTGSVCALLVQ